MKATLIFLIPFIFSITCHAENITIDERILMIDHYQKELKIDDFVKEVKSHLDLTVQEVITRTESRSTKNGPISFSFSNDITNWVTQNQEDIINYSELVEENDKLLTLGLESYVLHNKSLIYKLKLLQLETLAAIYSSIQNEGFNSENEYQFAEVMSSIRFNFFGKHTKTECTTYKHVAHETKASRSFISLALGINFTESRSTKFKEYVEKFCDQMVDVYRVEARLGHVDRLIANQVKALVSLSLLKKNQDQNWGL